MHNLEESKNKIWKMEILNQLVVSVIWVMLSDALDVPIVVFLLLKKEIKLN
jgi:hypothetical protein